MPDSNLSRLSSIRIKIRRLTKSPSEAQLASATIDDYVNTFILYDMPADVSLNSLKTVLRFYTQPNKAAYSTNTTDPNDPLYNFKNVYRLASNTVHLSGSLSYWTDSRADFYNQYPRTVVEASEGTGNDVLTNFTGTLGSIPVLENTIIFASTDLNDNPIKVYDDGAGNLAGDGTGTINYVTGVYDVTFNTAPKNGQDVYSQSYAYTPARPTTMLFYDNTFELRPIPDKSYSVEVEVFVRPTELLVDGDLPELSQWWEYIAYGAARKVLMDRADFETAAILKEEMENKRDEVLYKTVIETTVKEGYGL